MTVTTSLKPGIAARRIASFEKRFGQEHLYLAYHAALPLVLTSDILYSLWINFRQDICGQALDIPWFAVSDLLLSSLCNEVGYELYQMDATVRNELLNRLKQDERFGKTRVEELSNFLLDYIHQQLRSNEPDVQNLAKAQRWAALAYTRPHKTTYELALAFSRLNFDNPAEILRMSSLLETLALPIQGFQSLLTYARGISAFIRGNIEVATAHLKELASVDNQIRIAGVKLPIPAPVQSKLNALHSEHTINFCRANLQGQSFEGKDLTGADFSYSDIQGTDFTNAILVGAKFTHTTAGLRNSWNPIIIFCSILLSLSSGIGAIIMGYYLQSFVISPPNEATYIFAVSILLLFTVICIVIFRRGIEATLGSVTLAITGILALVATIILPANWSWGEKTILAIAGIIALVVGGSSARLGVLGFLGEWATRWTIAVGVLFGCSSSFVQAKLDAWFAIYNYNYELNNLIVQDIILALVAAIGSILAEAIGMALAMIVNRTLALTVSLCCIPIWFLFLIRSGTGLDSAGSTLILISIAGLGFYVGWQAIKGNEKYAFVVNATVAATSFWMRGTSFRGANLTDADFSDATLKGVDFSDANLTRTSWFHAKELNLACVGESYLKSPKIKELMTTGLGQDKNFDYLSLKGLNLSGANLEDASFIGADLSQANLQDANLCGAKLVKTQLEQADFTGACLTGACIQDWKIARSTKLDGVECDYIYTRLTTPDNPNPCRQPEDYQKTFEPGDFADFVQYIESLRSD
ncbi:MAG: pentapeptide repeat-containing protein [Rivularia sp. (in: Bacteria)]|nr:pentapeptide repeat-containing protein [Rivularia sp. MS3]